MYYLTLDTNTWIYMANGTEPVKLLHFILKEMDNGNITLIIPKIIVEEWHNNKAKGVRKYAESHFEQVIEAIGRIKKLLGPKGEKNEFRFLIDEFPEFSGIQYSIDLESIESKLKESKEVIASAISENIITIENIFEHSKTVLVEPTSSVFQEAGELALAKKAPFLNKNSFADAIIFLSFIDYVKKHSISGAMFISCNTSDFCNKDKKTFHDDLIRYLNETNSKYFHIVSEAINSIKENFITQQEIDWIKEMQDEEFRNTPHFCEVCSTLSDHRNEVIFQGTHKLKDSRKNIFEIDPNQLELEFALNFPKTTFEKLPTEIKVGYCNWCDTEHFECVRCGTINAIWSNEYEEPKSCDGCDLLFLVQEQNWYGDGESTYELLDSANESSEDNSEVEE